jgi:eukaryotic-like serine/threonine-protein kinase
MPLSAGTRLGPYEILARIGAGGMGEVYRARDPRMGREVAIKISAERFSDRFSREVHAVAALNHSNICHLYDVGPDYLVMELVEGPTLAERIKQGAVPLEEGLKIAKQIASALEAAHEKGIVHRDLKPANIKLTAEGVVKVLDFGLAKRTREFEGADPEHSPTLTLDAATRAGTVLGTAAYMSPEQARGKTVDKRADIWAFGVVLYELLSGERLFNGGDVSEIIAAVIKEEPKFDFVPREVRRLLAKCLAKDSKQRLRDIGDAWDLIEEAPPPRAGAGGRTAVAGWTIAALLLIVLAAVTLAHFREPPRFDRALRLKIEVPEGALSPHLAISPDGRTLAIAALLNGKRQLWLRPLDASRAQLMPGTEGATYPFWSADSHYIAFFAQSKLKKMLASGGPPEILCDAPDGRGGTWGRQNVILFSAVDGGGFAIRSVASTGGAPELAVRTARGISRYPLFLPDQRHFLYVVTRVAPEVNGIYFRSLDGKENRRILPDESGMAFAAGHLLFIRQNTLMALAVDAENGQTTGDPVPLAPDVSLTSNVIYAPVSASDTGILIYEAGGTMGGNNQLTWYGRSGKILETVGSAGPVYEPAISPDMKSVAFMRLSSTGSDLWLWDPTRRAEQRFTNDPAFARTPFWSPTGDSILFLSNRVGGKTNLYQKASSGTGQDTPLLVDASRKTATQWSRDGRFIVYSLVDAKTRDDVWVLPLEDGKPGKPFAFLHSEFNEDFGQLSPDTHWMAYTSDESGRPEVYVRTFPAGEDPKKISIDGGEQARWSGDGKELYFVAADSKIMAVPMKLQPGTKTPLEPGAPQVLFAAPPLATLDVQMYNYDVTADGQRFLLNTAVGGAALPPLNLILNWEAQLKK